MSVFRGARGSRGRGTGARRRGVGGGGGISNTTSLGLFTPAGCPDSTEVVGQRLGFHSRMLGRYRQPIVSRQLRLQPFHHSRELPSKVVPLFRVIWKDERLDRTWRRQFLWSSSLGRFGHHRQYVFIWHHLHRHYLPIM